MNQHHEKQVRRRLILIGSIDDQHNRLLKIAETYAGAGYEVRLLGWDRLCRRQPVCSVGPLHCEYLSTGFGYSNWRLLFGYPLWAWRVYWKSRNLEADLAHVFELDSAFPFALACRRKRIPFVYDVQDNYDLRHNWPFPLKQIIRRVDRWVLHQAAGVIVPDTNRLVGPFADFREKTAIIPNCPPDVPPPSDESHGDDVKLTILAMGELSERRGITLLLDAVQSLPSVRVLMAGRFASPGLEARARSMPQVDFRGWVSWDQAICLGYRADVVFAFYDPSYRVNLLANAQKWFDAMMTGRPIISNSEIANAKWIAEEEIGYVCSYGDKLELQRLLVHVLKHPEEVRRRGQRGRHLYEQSFNWALMKERLVALASRSAARHPMLAARGGAETR